MHLQYTFFITDFQKISFGEARRTEKLNWRGLTGV